MNAIKERTIKSPRHLDLRQEKPACRESLKKKRAPGVGFPVGTKKIKDFSSLLLHLELILFFWTLTIRNGMTESFCLRFRLKTVIKTNQDRIMFTSPWLKRIDTKNSPCQR